MLFKVDAERKTGRFKTWPNGHGVSLELDTGEGVIYSAVRFGRKLQPQTSADGQPRWTRDKHPSSYVYTVDENFGITERDPEITEVDSLLKSMQERFPRSQLTESLKVYRSELQK